MHLHLDLKNMNFNNKTVASNSDTSNGNKKTHDDRMKQSLISVHTVFIFIHIQISHFLT